MAYVESTGGKLHYEEIDLVAPWEAKRETIVFHHGIGASAGIWTEWLPELVTRYRIVTFDMRGYGRSHIPAPDAKWSLAILADDVLAIADAACGTEGAELAHRARPGRENHAGTVRPGARFQPACRGALWCASAQGARTVVPLYHPPGVSPTNGSSAMAKAKSCCN